MGSGLDGTDACTALGPKTILQDSILQIGNRIASAPIREVLGERETVVSSREFLFFQGMGSAGPNLCGGRVEPLMDVSKFGVGGNLSFAT